MAGVTDRGLMRMKTGCLRVHCFPLAGPLFPRFWFIAPGFPGKTRRLTGAPKEPEKNISPTHENHPFER
jgi:hypothetical protein